MKRRILITVTCGMLFTGIGQAQKKRMSGPEAKNQKPWQSRTGQTVILVKNHDHPPLTGPVAKNRKPWQDDCHKLPVLFQSRKYLTGPVAKNTRPEHEMYWEANTLLTREGK